MNAKLARQKKRKADPRGYGMTIGAYVAKEMYEEIVAVAEKQGRTISNVVEICIAKHLPKMK